MEFCERSSRNSHDFCCQRSKKLAANSATLPSLLTSPNQPIRLLYTHTRLQPLPFLLHATKKKLKKNSRATNTLNDHLSMARFVPYIPDRSNRQLIGARCGGDAAGFANVHPREQSPRCISLCEERKKATVAISAALHKFFRQIV